MGNSKFYVVNLTLLKSPCGETIFISQAIYVVKENPDTVDRGQKSGRVRGRDQLQHVAMLLGRTAWRHVGGLPQQTGGSRAQTHPRLSSKRMGICSLPQPAPPPTPAPEAP